MKYADIIPYIEKGLVSERSHPLQESLKIFNYTQKCQFDGAWDDVTRQCRGLIIDTDTDEIIARPFPKFFNYNEHIDKNWPIPDETPVVMDKMDGSLGILYILKGVPWIATRGSFESEQAMWATQWFQKHVGHIVLKDETNLFEIIYPENRIVVNYDFSGLVYLATIQTSTGKELHKPWSWPIRDVKHYPFTSFEELAMKNEPNSEGFVLYFPQSSTRMKIKFAEYVRLHKLITGVSEIAIWEHLRDGNDLDDLLEKVPDEFMQWVRQVQQRIYDQYLEIEENSKFMMLEVMQLETRKEKALYIKEKAKYPSIVFAMLDEKDYKKLIMRMIRPHGNSAFKVDIDK